MKSDWYDLMSRILDVFLADERQGMGELVKKANTSVRRYGTRATVSEQEGLSASEE